MRRVVPAREAASRLVTEPVYQQLTRICRERLGVAARAGDRFPSERALAREFGISRATANKVLSSLAAEGALLHRRGRGMFVSGAKNLHASLREMESFTAVAEASGFQPGTSVTVFRRLTAGLAPASVRAGMGLGGDEPLVYVERRRLADGEPVILEYRWIRAALVPGLRKADLGGSFYALLEHRFRVPLAGERHAVYARALPAPEARKLNLAPGAAALVVEGPGFTAREVAVWYQVLHYRGDRYHLENVVRLHHRETSTEMKFRSE
jgi:DNA-binding GntR family transcriptional regulator